MSQDIEQVEQEKEYFCIECGREFTRDEADAEEFISRDGRNYCRECYRDAYPAECINHPGRKVSTVCSVCLEELCDDCLVELQGNKVCESCKSWVLERMREGYNFPFSNFFLPDKFLRSNATISEYLDTTAMIKTPMPAIISSFIIIVVITCLIIFASDSTFAGIVGVFIIFFSILPIIFFANVSKRIRGIFIDRTGFRGARPRGGPVQILWKHLESAEIFAKGLSRRKQSIRLKSSDVDVRITGRFKRFSDIADLVREICRRRNIPCTEK